ncbi:MAG: hypothetical protein OEL55_03985, partial [Desulfobulbaceae bacterium]|nr:hypothetical protein [Desulfobulbaceae bacterium]
MSINSPAVLDRLERSAQQESFSRLQTEQYELNVRVASLKERVSSMATLPGVRDIIGYRGEQTIDLSKAGKRFTELVNIWFGQRHEVLMVNLFDLEGHDRFALARNGNGGEFIIAEGGFNSSSDISPISKEVAELSAGVVLVQDIEVDHKIDDDNTQHIYGVSLLTPVAVKGKIIGFLSCKVNMTDFLRDYTLSFWLNREGKPLHGHELDNGDAHTHVLDVLNDKSSEKFPGIKTLLVDNKAVVWSGKDGKKVTWQPIIFNEDMPATLWVGHDVDRSDLEKWVEGQQYRVFLLVAGLVLIVILLAGKIAVFVDKRRAELLAGFGAIISGEKPKPFAWRGVREIKQMASELNILTERFFDMRHARQCAEEELRESNVRLEEIIERRTGELFATNEQLSKEVEERSRAEDELILHRDQLEELVRQRLVEVAETNEQLQLEMVRRKHAQDSVRKNEARLRVILDSVPIGIFIVDRDKQTITYA